MYRRWVSIALLITAGLFVGLNPVDRERIAAMQRGDRLAAERRYSDALQAYEVAAERCSGCPRPRLRQGEVYAAQGRYDEAWAAYLVAIQLGGVGTETMEGLARLHSAQHSEHRAIGYLQRLLARRPGGGELWIQLGEAYLATGQKAKATGALEHALGLYITGQQRQSVHGRLGIVCVETDPRCALDHFLEVERGPDPALARDVARLIAALRTMIDPGGQAHDDPALVRAKLGEALYRHGDLMLARRQFEAAIELEPAYVDGHAYLGHVLSLLGESELAVQHLERAIALEPAYTLPYYFLGVHYVRQGRRITGRGYLEQAYDVDPTNPAICAALADTYLRAQPAAYAVAERWLHAAVDNAPDDPRFHLLLAHFYVDYMIDPGVRGVAVAQVAANLAPESSDAQETLGWAYYLAGNADLALDPLKRAQDLDLGEPRIHYRLGEVYRALGRASLARQSYQQAIDLDWNGPIGDRARQSMAR